ncbi:MAG: LamG-like jellyroll fold domain-containing protein, partial [Bacteroides sp.]
LLVFPYSIAMQAQVDNYALRLDKQASVDFKSIPELNNLSTYTLQFWFNPNVWNTGATLLTRDAGVSLFAIRLGAVGTLEYCVGNDVVLITDSHLRAGKWAQVTLTYDANKLEAWVNNVPVTIVASGSYTIPTSQAYFKMGGNYTGRLDEIRLYKAKVEPEFHLWQNTLNYLHPYWGELISYWKLDQFCENIADYKLMHNGERSAGAIREKVTDNDLFKYRVMTAYTGFSRFFDRSFDRHKILLANDLLLLVCYSTAEGTIVMEDPESSGTLTRCTYLSEYEGRKGVISFNGNGAKMDVGPEALTPQPIPTAYNDGSYTFSTWLYINNWVKDAYLFRKEATDKVGFSVRLGDESTHELI